MSTPFSGALEAGVGFACGYPGTPSSEITDTFARIHKRHNIVFEYSVNEKVCVEMAFAASLAGARSICAMKHLGLMVGGDPISTIPYVGVDAHDAGEIHRRFDRCLYRVQLDATILCN